MYRLSGKTSLQLMMESGEIVRSPVNAIDNLFDYSLGQDAHVERSAILGEAYPIVSLDAPGSIQELMDDMTSSSLVRYSSKVMVSS